jgi:hypothetical protein
MPEGSLHAGTRDDASDRAGNVEAPDPYTIVVRMYVYSTDIRIYTKMYDTMLYFLPLGSLRTWDFA